MKKIFFSLLLSVLAISSIAQIQEPVKFSAELKIISDSEAEIIFTGTIDDGWHVYSTELPSGGPTSSSITIEEIKGAETDGKLTSGGSEIKAFDKVFEINLRYFEKNVVFVQKIKITAPVYQIKGYLEYAACNEESCLPPADVSFNYTNGDVEAIAGNSQTGVSGVSESSDYWTPVIKELDSFGETFGKSDISWIYIFITGFLGGLLALFTPCVWPIIPMTVSFFLKKNKAKKRGIRDAITYGVSIIVIYVLLGLAVTLIFGASALNALSTNAIFNILFFLMLVIFAASFFGAFEITLPSSWSTAVDSKAEKTGGLIGIFLMAFTLALVSFSCTGPIIT